MDNQRTQFSFRILNLMKVGPASRSGRSRSSPAASIDTERFLHVIGRQGGVRDAERSAPSSLPDSSSRTRTSKSACFTLTRVKEYRGAMITHKNDGAMSSTELTTASSAISKNHAFSWKINQIRFLRLSLPFEDDVSHFQLDGNLLQVVDRHPPLNVSSSSCYTGVIFYL